jgi:hypothetical protein
MVFNLNGKALVGGIHGRPLGDGPRLEDASVFQAKVPVEMGGVVFVDEEAGH